MEQDRKARLQSAPAAAHRIAPGAFFSIRTNGSMTPWPAKALDKLIAALGQYASACTAPAAAACCCKLPTPPNDLVIE